MKLKKMEWFISRVGKRIFRDEDGCKCGSCNDVVKKGLVIMDKFHAEYLFDTQNDWAAEGIELNYRDKK